MAKTNFATGNALTRKAWAEKLYRDTVKESYFSKFFGSDTNALVYMKTELEKEHGDKVTCGIRMRLTGAGVTSGTALEGNEEKLTTYDTSVTLEEYAHAVRDKGPLDRKRPNFSVDAESKQALMDWGGEKIDSLCFAAVTASPTKIFYGGDATSTATLEAGDKLTPALISKIKTAAKTGLNRTYVPFRPVKVGGKKYFVLLTHPDSLYDLKRSSEFTQAMREAEARGSENPLFHDAVAIWDNVVIHEHENIELFTTWGAGSDVAGCKAVFMGAQALAWAWGARQESVAEEFDYGREHGYAWKIIAGVAKPVFNSLDYGSFGVYVSRTKISDA